MSVYNEIQDYHRRELKIICPRLGGEFIDGKCILTHVNDELRSNYNYHGWRNYETWAVDMYLSNEEGIYNYIHNEIIPECEEETLNELEMRAGFTHRDKLIYCVAQKLKEMIEEQEPELDSPFAELLRTDKVDWNELAEAYVGERG